jgi:hypothetical protein
MVAARDEPVDVEAGAPQDRPQAVTIEVDEIDPRSRRPPALIERRSAPQPMTSVRSRPDSSTTRSPLVLSNISPSRT